MWEHLRDQSPRTWRDAEETPRALILVVDDTRLEGQIAPEAQILQAGVTAMMALFTDPDPDLRAAVSRWVSGRIRKLVKRARGSAWHRALDCGLPVAVATEGRAQVAAFMPIPVAEQPSDLRRLQVTGLQSNELAPAEVTRAHLAVVLDASLGMSTGKRVAQVCHAAQLFAMRGPDRQIATWAAGGYPIRVSATTPLDPTQADLVVRDAGYTEVPAGALTCMASWQPG